MTQDESQAVVDRSPIMVGEVEELLHPAHEVTGGELGAAEHVVEVVALGPAVGRPRETEVRLP